ncbi:hypothetical protein [Streptomyces apocyni]|uniref:hypothetical protein n=1 Tax=Streptomyces apocyni TaxID=2654677 RepID=UPI0012EAE9B0|nr:hypothetical protein [Streptomyces apocyni]
MDTASSQTPGARQQTCVRCNELTARPVLVAEVHQNSGPGFSVYVCPDCAVHFPPLPDAYARGAAR